MALRQTKKKQRDIRLRQQKHRHRYGPKEENPTALIKGLGQQPPQEAWHVSQALKAESYLRDSLNQCKRTIGAGKINLEVGNIMKILPRIVASVVEFNLFMDEDPSAEWYRGEFIGIVTQDEDEDETISDGDSEDFIMPYKAGRA